jgi:hypothetical protein
MPESALNPESRRGFRLPGQAADGAATRADSRSSANSFAVWRSLTHVSQSAGCSGHSLIRPRSWGEPRARRHRLPTAVRGSGRRARGRRCFVLEHPRSGKKLQRRRVTGTLPEWVA